MRGPAAWPAPWRSGAAMAATPRAAGRPACAALPPRHWLGAPSPEQQEEDRGGGCGVDIGDRSQEYEENRYKGYNCHFAWLLIKK